MMLDDIVERFKARKSKELNIFLRISGLLTANYEFFKVSERFTKKSPCVIISLK